MLTEQEKQIMQYGVQQGKSASEIKAAVAKFRSSGGASSVSQTPTEQKSGDGVLSRVGDVISTQGENVRQAIQGEGQYQDASTINRSVSATAEAFKAIPETAVAVAPEPVRTAIGKVGDIVGKGFSFITDKVASTKLFSDIGRLEAQGFINPQDNPEFYQLKDALQTSVGGGEIAGSILAAEGGLKTATVGTDVAKTGFEVGSGVVRSADEAFQSGIDIAKNTQEAITSKISGKNIDPQLQSSAERLSQPRRFLEGVSDRVTNPIALYDKWLQQSKKAISDIKVDPAISEVGSDIGKAFNTVIKQRRQVGQILGDELKKFGSKVVDMKNPVGTLQQQLIDSGATFDALTKQVSAGATSKFTQLDLNLLQKYADELEFLGKNPTASQVDAFVSRIPREIKELRAKSGTNTMTNAERIISSNLNDVREALRPIATKEYNAARKAYSDLSSFVDEGANFLGKITQTGDFAKDASLAKSSVQSILNNGKKDWLIKLEALTGEPLLDKSVLALQAMKDAGDFRGVSLLEMLSEGSLPTSKAGILQKFVDFGLSKTAEKLIGAPEEQTRKFLNDLIKQQK